MRNSVIAGSPQMDLIQLKEAVNKLGHWSTLRSNCFNSTRYISLIYGSSCFSCCRFFVYFNSFILFFSCFRVNVDFSCFRGLCWKIQQFRLNFVTVLCEAVQFYCIIHMNNFQFVHISSYYYYCYFILQFLLEVKTMPMQSSLCVFLLHLHELTMQNATPCQLHTRFLSGFFDSRDRMVRM